MHNLSTHLGTQLRAPSDKTIDSHYSCSNMDIIIVMCIASGYTVRGCTDFARQRNESDHLCMHTVRRRWTIQKNLCQVSSQWQMERIERKRRWIMNTVCTVHYVKPIRAEHNFIYLNLVFISFNFASLQCFVLHLQPPHGFHSFFFFFAFPVILPLPAIYGVVWRSIIPTRLIDILSDDALHGEQWTRMSAPVLDLDGGTHEILPANTAHREIAYWKCF